MLSKNLNSNDNNSQQKTSLYKCRESDVEKMNELFQLSDVQMAYFMGRDEKFELGGVSCHYYIEIESKLEIGRLNLALKKLIERHPMLRAIILPEGKQCILKEVPKYKVETVDLSDYSEADKQQRILNERERMSHYVFKTDQWPLFELKSFKLSDCTNYLFFGIEVLIADALSIQIITKELMDLYNDPQAQLEEIEFNFRDFMIAMSDFKESESYKRDKEFWLQKLDSLPAAPSLPLAQEPSVIGKPRFRRLSENISKKYWDMLKIKCTEKNIRPSVVFCTAYAQALAFWCNQSQFTINFTVSNRYPFHKDVNKIIGDFTSIMLIEADFRSNMSFWERACKIQDTLTEALEHRHYDGIELIREISKVNNLGHKAVMPVVFTSLMFADHQDGWSQFGEIKYNVTQTSQLHLDNQVTKSLNGINIRWDYVEQLFDKEVIENIFETYIGILTSLLDDEEYKVELNEHDSAINLNYNNSDEDIEPSTLNGLFAAQVSKTPENKAVIFDDQSITYKELNEMSDCIARYLGQLGVQKGDTVGILAERKINTITNMMGVLKAGAAYVPINIEHPESRRNFILQNSGCKLMLEPEAYINLNLKEYSSGELKFTPQPEDTAYIIYTSGSTGMPKGVVITHGAAANTIIDINQKFGINEKDKIIGVSSMCFDLSVYDIFGALSTGAALVMIPDQRDVMGLIKVILEQKITVWNSVPAIMDMVTQNLENDYTNNHLRVVMLSGDWIPLKLPKRIKKYFIKSELISLGGATEASIWSIYHPITEIKSHWKSIPYGRPLANQKFYVLNYNMEQCPVGVAGELFIGGVGVARGYANDKEKTQNAFIDHDKFGYIYKTGDYGVMHKEGYIEFLGRKDHQVKIRGHRIELGEIEYALRDYPEVSDAAVVLYEKNNVKQLVGYVVPVGPDSSNDFEVNSENITVPDKAWHDMVDGGRAHSCYIPEGVSIKAYGEFDKKIEKISTVYICNSLKKLNAFAKKGECWSLDRLIDSCRILPKYKKLMGQWVSILEEDGFIRKVDDCSYECISPITEIPIEPLLQELRSFDLGNEWKVPLEYLESFGSNIVNILIGKLNPLNLLFPDGSWDLAERIYQFNPVAVYMNNIVSQVVAAISDNWTKDRKLRILEFGAGTGGTTAAILSKLPAEKINYTFTDISTFFTDKAKIKFKDYPFIEYKVLDIDKNPLEQGYAPHSYDIIFGANVLHDACILSKTMEYFKSILAPNGLFVALEITKNTRLHKISIGLIDGFSNYADEREKANLPLISAEEWGTLMKDNGFDKFVSFPEAGFDTEVFFQHVVIARGPLKTRWIKPNDMKSFLNEKIPDYMVPNYIINLEKLPLTANGKIDRKALPEPEEQVESVEEYVAPRNELEKKLADIWEKALGVQKISIFENFFILGGDSLKAIQISAKARQEAIEISITDIYDNATIENLAEAIQSKISKSVENMELVTSDSKIEEALNITDHNFEPDCSSMGEPFAMTDVQVAYLIGRSPNIELGGVSTHYYMEIETRLEINRLSRSLQKVIKRHPMLRAIVLPDGKQKVLEEVDDYWIEEMDIRHLSPDDQNARIAKEKERMSHHIFKTDQWPLFEYKAFKLSDELSYLCIGFDILITDGSSIYIIGKELKEFYDNIDLELTALNYTFKDYISAYGKFRKSEVYSAERKYWLEKLKDFPPSPTLPLKKDPMEVSAPHRFKRCIKVIDKKNWAKLKQKALENNYTPAALMCTAYAEVLSFWSNQKRFAIDLTVFNRYPFHKDVEKIIGDFTSIILLDIDLKDGGFWEHARYVQKSLTESLEHRHYDGVEFIREISKYNNMGTRAVMPVIFTCVLFDDTRDGWTEIGVIKDGISQTPQVYLDNQILDMNSELRISWDYVEELFDEKLVNTMFNQYIAILESLIYSHGDQKILLPEKHIAAVEKYNQTEENIIPTTLCSLFSKQVISMPMNIAVELNGVGITYKELDRISNCIACYLKDQKVVKGDRVGILASREINTIANILGVLKAGAAYVPVSPEHPEERRNYILEDSRSKLLLEPDVYIKNDLDKYINKKLELVSEIEDVAYIIYTSGSTGRPKGVVITHGAVSNTIIDINQKFNVSEKDRIIGISSMCFDLSVYDIFGALSTGASLVLIQDQRDVISLIETVRKHRITIWNSVPAIMDMALENIENDADIESLRLVMLSGDWIPLKLPQKIRNYFKNADIISLGGATEASIWSIYYPIGEIMPNWKSIPYGKPLANQKFYVLNYNMDLCPIGVPGELYIGGLGVAAGYMNDPEKTKTAFINHEVYGYIYKTGDYGVMHDEGCIEFLGRKDHQIKIRGHRIELGEIENSILKNKKVKNAAVIDINDDYGNKALCAYIVTSENVTASEMRHHLQKELPDYMIPGYFVEIEKIPLTANGKVDRKTLPEPKITVEVKAEYTLPKNNIEEMLVNAWQEVMGVPKVGTKDNFFALGGDSIKAIQISAYIQRYGLKLGVSEQFTYQCIGKLSEHVKSVKKKAEQGVIIGDVKMTPPQKWFFENGIIAKNHWNQSFILSRKNIDENALRASVQKLLEHHDALRMVYRLEDDGQICQFNRGIEESLFDIKVFDITMNEDFNNIMQQEILIIQQSMDLQNGPLVRVGIFRTMNVDYMLFAIHHLVVDGVSWRILLEDFIAGYNLALNGEQIILQDKTTSYREWSKQLYKYAESPELINQKEYWKRINGVCTEPLAVKTEKYSNKFGDSDSVSVKLSSELTDLLLKKVNKAYNTEINDIMLTALGLSFNVYNKTKEFVITVEGHGREEIIDDVDITRTVGWFTSMYPVVLDIDESADISKNIKAIKEHLRGIPSKGIGYGILKYLSSRRNMQDTVFTLKPSISFNYLGQFERKLKTDTFDVYPVLGNSSVSPDIERSNTMDIVAMVIDGCMNIELIFNKYKYDKDEIISISKLYEKKLTEIIEYCSYKEETEATPSDFEYKGVTLEDLDDISDLINS